MLYNDVTYNVLRMVAIGRDEILRGIYRNNGNHILYETTYTKITPPIENANQLAHLYFIGDECSILTFQLESIINAI